MLMATEQTQTWHQTFVEPEQWCMVGVRPGKEPECCDSFRRQGLRCYWPNYYVFGYSKPRRAARRGQPYRSVMPGYLFMPLPATDLFWNVVERWSGVAHPIRSYSGDLLALHNEDIQVIRKIEAGLNTPVPRKSLHNFKTGDKVRFSDDLLTRWPPGRVARLADDGRIAVEVDLMGRSVPFLVWPHQIERM